jgi:class 3 adenylate cyclase
MSWNHARAQERIIGFRDQAPSIVVERYADEYMPRFAREQFLASLMDGASSVSPLYDLSDGAAVLVDTVQVYVRAINYDDVRLEQGVETERGHARGLAFLHLLYGAADRVVEHVGAQRVDFHGARMHAVVIEPSGDASVQARIATGLSLAQEMMALAREAGREIVRGMDLALRFRVGIDIGPCVAINSGRTDEHEPMFIGSSANHAAKLAAGDVEGIYLSDRVRAAFGLRRAASIYEERGLPASMSEIASLRDAGGFGATVEVATAWPARHLARRCTGAPVRHH